MLLFFIKPYPPAAVRSCPVPEAYKYGWEPVALKILAFLVKKEFPRAETRIWHLMDESEVPPLLDSIARERPLMAVFTETDLLVPAVNFLAGRIKEIDPGIITVAGGKQSSTLRPGDPFPFRHIDRAFRGGPDGLLRYIERLLGRPGRERIDGEMRPGAGGTVEGDGSFSGRGHLGGGFDNTGMRKLPVENHTALSYARDHQQHPSLLEGEVRTSPVYGGEGCPHNCVFCQSPVEFAPGGRSLLCDPVPVAKEMEWLMKEQGVNNFFFLSPNLDLDQLREVYTVLASLGIRHASVSGFIRAADILRAHRKNDLGFLAEKGMRVLSVGLDVPLDTRTDRYRKSFSYQDMREALEICREHGILVLATMPGDPRLGREAFARQLDAAKSLEVADIDIRLVIAIRNTAFYQEHKDRLLHDPGKEEAYFEQQNYRYQTMQFSGGILPEETYALVNDFYRTFPFDGRHLSYVRGMMEKHPDTAPFFRRQYLRHGGIPV